MMKTDMEMFINVSAGGTRIALTETGKLVELHIERADYERMVGNIYKGKVQNVIPGMQAAFVEYDGLQCGYCTPGQICSAVGALDEFGKGMPSHVTADLSNISLSDDELRERMSGNLCRCAAYPNIIAAIRSVAEAQS